MGQVHDLFTSYPFSFLWGVGLLVMDGSFVSLPHLDATLLNFGRFQYHLRTTSSSPESPLTSLFLMSAGTCWRLSAQRPDRASLSSCWICSSTLRIKWRICPHELSCVLTPCQVSGLHSVGVTFSALFALAEQVLSSALYQVLPRLWKGLKTE